MPVAGRVYGPEAEVVDDVGGVGSREGEGRVGDSAQGAGSYVHGDRRGDMECRVYVR